MPSLSNDMRDDTTILSSQRPMLTPDIATPLTRRTLIKRVGLGLGALFASIAALAVADADHADTDVPLYTRALGQSGPQLVLLPGIGATTRYWELVAGPLAAAMRLLLVDLLGFGRSQKPWITYTVDRHIAELHRVLAPVGARQPFTLVAHSLGARLAITYAARYPAEVERLILVSLPFFGGEEQAKTFIRSRHSSGWLWTHMIPFALTCLLGRRLLGWAAPLLARGVPREVAEDANQMTWRSSTSTMWEVIYRYDLTTDLRRLPPTLPMLCLHGDRDESAPLDRMRALQALHPNCDIRVYPGADHQLPLRQPRWVRDQIMTVVTMTSPAATAAP